MDQGATEIIGSMSIEKKEEILIAFAKGEINRIITKAKMTSFGLNWTCGGTGGVYRVDRADDLDWLYSTFGDQLP